MRKQTNTHPKRNPNLRLKSLDYTKNKNSLWRFELFKNFRMSFDIRRFNSNLKQVNLLSKKDARYLPFAGFYAHYWNIYKDGINNFDHTYYDSEVLLSQFIPFEKGPKSLSFQDVRNFVKNRFINSTEPWVIIGNDHRISHATIKELVLQNKKRTAVIVIDNHTDIYGHAPAKNNPLKFNPFRNLIESGSIKHAFFLCPSFKELLDNRPSWEDISDSVSFAPLVSSGGKIIFDEMNFETELTRIVKRKSIENIFFSIDIDVLADTRENKAYSAFEYSILNSILYLSLLSNEQIKVYEHLSTCLIDAREFFPKKRKPATTIRIRNPYKPGLNTVNELGISPIMCCNIIQTIAEISKKLGVKVGLGSCRGEVVELMGPDWKGETTRATLKIVDSLNAI